jgi:ferredoxin-NADP reductase
MARAAVLGRLSWQVGTVAAVRDETVAARTITIDLPDWPGHAPGQHVDVRLTAPDGYSAQRSYSIGSAPEDGRIELTVQRIDDGEVSPYLTQTLQPGYPLELRGPIGGWFVWDPADPRPVLLLAGGSGIVPLMSMIRTRTRAGRTTPFRLLYSVRTPGAALYAAELAERHLADNGLAISYAYTRSAPPDAVRPPGRIDAGLLAEAGFTPGTAPADTAGGWPADATPAVFICGPTAFVEAAAGLLVTAGHDPRMIKTERFGPSGG